MTSKLQTILLQKQREVEALYACGLEKIAIKPRSCKSLQAALTQSSLAVIAEIKRQSPSKGKLAAIADPLLLAKRYVTGGASAISILTDELFFNGRLTDLTSVANAIALSSVPILRKDFIIDEIQLTESYHAQADAVLLIVAVLKEKTTKMLEYVHGLGLEALVEVHKQDELELALASGAKIIGINNRDLTTFVVDTSHALKLGKAIPPSIIKVAESGIATPEMARAYREAGFDAVLIGEALVKAESPELFIRDCL